MLDRVGIVSGGVQNYTPLVLEIRARLGNLVEGAASLLGGGCGGGLWHGGAPRWIYLQKGWAFWQGLRLGSRVR